MADTSYQRFTDRKEGLKKMMIGGGGGDKVFKLCDLSCFKFQHKQFCST